MLQADIVTTLPVFMLNTFKQREGVEMHTCFQNFSLEKLHSSVHKQTWPSFQELNLKSVSSDKLDFLGILVGY